MIELHKGWRGSQKAFVLAGILLSCALHLGAAQKQVSLILEPPNPQAGQDVTLAVRGGPQRFKLCEWNRQLRNRDAEIILEYTPSQSPQHKNGTGRSGRETVRDDCSLRITDLRQSDTGNYTVIFEVDRTKQEPGHRPDQRLDEFYEGSVYLQVSATNQITITVRAVPQQPNQGGEVTLTPQGIPRDIEFCEWFKEGSSGNIQSLIYYTAREQDPQRDDSSRHERVTVGQDCSLRMKKLTADDSATYTVKIQALLGWGQQQPGPGSRPQEPSGIQEYWGQVELRVNQPSNTNQQKGGAAGLSCSAGIVVGALLVFLTWTDTFPSLFHGLRSSSSRPGRLL